MSLKGQVAIVTGASRGIGRGIALQLGEAGATVYITGRQPSQSLSSANSDYLPQLDQTAKKITDRGGKGIVAYVDHSNMEEVKAFFEKIDKENNGRLDVLVNNAYSAASTISEAIGKTFFERPPEDWDEINNVGLRNHYFCSVYAARIMDKRKSGLIVNVTSVGGLKYFFNVPYGVGKQALDRMSADMAVELKKSNVTVVSILPGAVRTEFIMKNFVQSEEKRAINPDMAKRFEEGESPEYPGKAVVALAKDSHRIKKTGRTLITTDLGCEYGFKDIDGRSPPHIRSLAGILMNGGYKKTAGWVPEWIRLPGWLMWTGTSRL